MSATNNGKNNLPVLQLRQLHLVPHFIYLINQRELILGDKYILQLWKDDKKMGETDEIEMKEHSQGHKYPTLEFKKLSFIFDVQALFEFDPSAKIKLKLSKQAGDQIILKQQFEIHILFYTFENSSTQFVRNKQNSIGKLKKFIFNYSFSAIFGEPSANPLFRKYQFERKPIDQYQLPPPIRRQQSKYGVLLKNSNKETNYDTITVAQKGAQHATLSMKHKQSESQNQSNSRSGFQIGWSERKAPRSFINVDLPNLNEESSNITEEETAEKIKSQSKYVGSWLLIFVGIILIFILMHPSKKI